MSSRSWSRAISAKPPGPFADMVVRGAGAIGATAAYGLAQGARGVSRHGSEKICRAMSRWFTKRSQRPGPRRWTRSTR